MQETNTYEISLQDVRAFVATKQPGEQVGKPLSRASCLVAHALAWKYPSITNIDVAGSNWFATFRDEQGDRRVIDLPADVESTADDFDRLKHGENWITRQQLEEHMPELFEEGAH